MASIKCGSCKGTHPSVAAVRECYGNVDGAIDRASNDGYANIVGADPYRDDYLMEAHNNQRGPSYDDIPDGVPDRYRPDNAKFFETKVTKPATPKQVAFIATLRKERRLEALAFSGNTKQASIEIDRLLAIPRKHEAPTRRDEAQFDYEANGAGMTDRQMLDDKPAKVPAGRYAIKIRDWDSGPSELHWEFYKINHGKGNWEGYTFVSKQAGDEEWPIRNGERRDNILKAIEHDPKAAAVAYGRELGVCSMCGRTLTVPESIAAGIGPICAEKF